MFRSLIAFTALVLAGVAPALAQQLPNNVHTAQGEVSGVWVGPAGSHEVGSYKGLPFAAPPVGELRWAPPAPAKPWKGVRKADAYGPACPQPSREDGGGGGRAGTQSEDCLTLNIWTPTVWAPAGKKPSPLPVMVWIHGGAHRVGSGSFPIYDGTEMARQGVILVTINYRLGLLGYFAHPALTAAAKPGEPLGNYGTMDQIAALQWVHDNIASFGGDPKNVTVFGESAGGSAVIYLLANPHAKGLFAKAIVESGGGLQRPKGLAEIEKLGVTQAAAIGLPANATLAQMRAKSPEDWIKAQGALLAGGLGFGPFIDGRLITEAPSEAFSSGRAADVPLIIGANSNEASVMATLGARPGAIRLIMGRQMEPFQKLYGAVPEDEFVRQAMGDITFVAPSRWIAQQEAKGAPSFLYYFSYVTERRRGSIPGASHGTEIPYVFKTWGLTPQIAAMVTDADKAMSNTMSACWVAFAKTGQPACDGAPAWPAYDPAKDELMEFAPKITVHKPEKAAAFDMIVAQYAKAPR